MEEPRRKIDLLVVLPAPTNHDDRYGKVVASTYWGKVTQLLFDVVQADKERVAFTYATKCYSKLGSQVDSEDIRICIDNYLQREIELFKPACVLVVGGSIASAYWNNSIKNLRGDVQNLYGAKAIISYHTLYAEKDNTGKALEQIANDFARAWSISQGFIPEVITTEYVVCESTFDIEELLGYIDSTGYASFDLETSGLEYRLPGFEINTIAISFQPGGGWVIPTSVKFGIFDEQQIRYIWSLLKSRVFENRAITKIAHNLDFDVNCLLSQGIRVLGPTHDTMLQAHVINPERSLKLKDLVATYFPEFDGYNEKIKSVGFNNAELDDLAAYNATDTDLTFRLFILNNILLLKDTRSYNLYRDLVMAVHPVIVDAENTGFIIDVDVLDEGIEKVSGYIEETQSRMLAYTEVQDYVDTKTADVNEQATVKAFVTYSKLKERIKKKDSKAVENARKKYHDLKSGAENLYQGLNLKSSTQLSDLIYHHPDGFNFVYEKDDDTVSYSADKLALKTLALKYKHPFILDLLLFRSISTTKSTFLDGIKKRLVGNKLHGSLLLHGTRTGRLSSRDPNLQNLPTIAKLKSPYAVDAVKWVKRSFVLPQGYVFLQWDFSQVELRLLAEFAQEKTMIDAYRKGLDIHSLTASKIAKVSYEDFNRLADAKKSDLRKKAKAVNFGFIYGMGWKTFKIYAFESFDLILTDREAKHFREVFFRTYSGLERYHKLVAEKGRKFLQVRTFFGRRRPVPDIKSSVDYLRSQAERICINSPIQGTAGELAQLAIKLLYLRLDPRVKFLNTVHDSGLYMLPKELLAETIETVKYTCENLPLMEVFGKEFQHVDIKIDIETGDKNWLELEKVDFN